MSESRGAENVQPLTPFEIMDRHALAAPDSVVTSPAQLVAYLIQPAKNPWDRTRAIFRWIAQNIEYDMASLLAGKYPDYDPEVVLRTRKGVCAGYAKLFVRLCEEAGIEAEYVTGHSREYGEEMDELLRKVDRQSAGHAWNVVKLGGQWHLLDVTWGAGHINGQRQFVREFDPHYFLTRPVEFIHTHYPEDPKWQLLPTPIDRATYDRLVHVRSGFFQHGLTLQSHRLMDIATTGPLKITLGAPQNIRLRATVERDGKDLARTLTFAQRRDKTYEIHACFPAPGRYLLKIFSQPKAKPGEEDEEEKHPMLWALGYKVHVSPPLPECPGYPIAFSSFSEHDAYLISPLSAQLAARSPLQFQLSIAGAKSAYVKTGTQFYPLHKQGTQFSGRVTPLPGELILFAQFPGEENTWGLLQYHVE